MRHCVFVQPIKDAAIKDMSGVKVKESVTESKLVDVTVPQQKDTEKTSTAAADSAEVEEYRAKLAEKRRLAREKAELEAAQEEERRRQQQLVAVSVL